MIDVLKALLALLQFILEGRRASSAEEKIRLDLLTATMEKRREDLKNAVAAGDVSAIARNISGV